MSYLEAVHWLRYQEYWSEKMICDFLNGDGDIAIIRCAEALVLDSEE